MAEELTHLVKKGGGFKEFLSELKKVGKVGKTVELGEIKKLLQNVESGVHSVDEALKDLPVTKAKGGFVLIGEETVGRINKILREADLGELVSVSKKNIKFSSADEKAFKNTVGKTPERSYRDVVELTETNKKSFPQLDAKVDELDRISKTGKEEIKKTENNLFKKFKKGTKIVLTIGAFYVAYDWIRTATEERKGCFMMTMINNKATSCKVQAYSCIGSGGTMCTGNLSYFNVTLVLMAIVKMPDSDDRKQKIATLVSIPVADLDGNLAKIIDNNFEVVAEMVDTLMGEPTTAINLTSICSMTHPDVENGKVPPCRLCTPSANPLSTEFIDSSQYGDNISFQCVVNPSILETISDAAISTGTDLLQGVSSGVSGALKPIAFLVIILLVLIIIAGVIFKVKKPPSAPANEHISITTERAA